MTAIVRYPFTAATTLEELPVLALKVPTTVSPGEMGPSRSA